LVGTGGMIRYQRSSHAKAAIQTAPSASVSLQRLIQREISRTKGIMKWPTSRIALSHVHPPTWRARKKVVSSGMFAYQISMYWL